MQIDLNKATKLLVVLATALPHIDEFKGTKLDVREVKKSTNILEKAITKTLKDANYAKYHADTEKYVVGLSKDLDRFIELAADMMLGDFQIFLNQLERYKSEASELHKTEKICIQTLN